MHQQAGQCAAHLNSYLDAIRQFAASRAAMRDDLSWHTCELFSELAENHPDVLSGFWEVLLALVRADESLWTLAPPADRPRDWESQEVVQPFINVVALHERWGELQERAWRAL